MLILSKNVPFQVVQSKPEFLKILIFFDLAFCIVGSMDQESSQQLQMWFSEHYFAPKLAGLIVTPTVSATVEQKWREKISENHIPVDFWDDSTLANQGAGKTIEKPLKELPWNQQCNNFECELKHFTIWIKYTGISEILILYRLLNCHNWRCEFYKKTLKIIMIKNVFQSLIIYLVLNGAST